CSQTAKQMADIGYHLRSNLSLHRGRSDPVGRWRCYAREREEQTTTGTSG
ncbi:hypothetical protein BgiBS90_009634, partial [Biomphalaria glabrata]